MHTKILIRVVVFAMLSIGLTTAPSVHAKLAPEQQCAKSRYAAAAQYASCVDKVLAQVFVTNDLAKLQPALSKCRVKYAGTYLKIQKKALGTGATCDAPRATSPTRTSEAARTAVILGPASSIGPRSFASFCSSKPISRTATRSTATGSAPAMTDPSGTSFGASGPSPSPASTPSMIVSTVRTGAGASRWSPFLSL